MRSLLSKTVQRAGEAQTGFQSKQLRAIMLSDQRVRQKIETANNQQIIRVIIAAAAKRLGMTALATASSSRSPTPARKEGAVVKDAKLVAEKTNQKTEAKRAVKYRLEPEQFKVRFLWQRLLLQVKKQSSWWRSSPHSREYMIGARAMVALLPLHLRSGKRLSWRSPSLAA